MVQGAHRCRCETHFWYCYLKVHSKLCLITRREDGQRVRYAYGTGNFNEKTAQTYQILDRLLGEITADSGLFIF